jgi:rhodanese-related sulfurtransferase
VITHCVIGPLEAMSAKTLKDMGFTNVAYIEGGIEAWKQAGLPGETAGGAPAGG